MAQRTPDHDLPFEERSTETLLRAVREGHAALAVLAARFAHVFAEANAHQPPGPARPSDAAQDCFWQFWQRHVQQLPYLETEANLTAYLATAARNQLHTNAADAGRQPTTFADGVPVVVDPLTPSKVVASAEAEEQRMADEEELHRSVAALPDADRMIYRLLFQHAPPWTHRAVAELLYGSPSEADRQRLIRRQRKIRDELTRLIWERDGRSPEEPRDDHRRCS